MNKNFKVSLWACCNQSQIWIDSQTWRTCETRVISQVNYFYITWVISWTLSPELCSFLSWKTTELTYLFGWIYVDKKARLRRHKGKSSCVSCILQCSAMCLWWCQAAFPCASKTQDGATGRPCFILLLFDLLQKLLTPHSSLNKIKQNKKTDKAQQQHKPGSLSLSLWTNSAFDYLGINTSICNKRWILWVRSSTR